MSKRRDAVPFAGEVSISPWDAILTEVRRSAYRAAWVDDRVETEAERERQLNANKAEWTDPIEYERLRMAQGRELREWLKVSREERAHGAQVARAAVQAGLSERYIESIQMEARLIAQTLQRALNAANLTEDQWAAATEELRAALADVGKELSARHSSMSGRVPERPAIEG